MSKTITTENNGEKSYFIYIQNILEEKEINEIKNWLETLTFCPGTSKSGTNINRKQIWYQEEQKYFCPTWNHRYDRWTSREYTEKLKKIQKKIEEILEKKYNIKNNFNSCLINLYENGNDFISPHKDSSDSFGLYPNIINLSIGETRVLRVFNKDKEFEFELENNSLFIMMGASQKEYLHEIVKDERKKEKRYSLTFRKMI